MKCGYVCDGRVRKWTSGTQRERQCSTESCWEQVGSKWFEFGSRGRDRSSLVVVDVAIERCIYVFTIQWEGFKSGLLYQGAVAEPGSTKLIRDLPMPSMVGHDT